MKISEETRIFFPSFENNLTELSRHNINSSVFVLVIHRRMTLYFIHDQPNQTYILSTISNKTCRVVVLRALCWRSKNTASQETKERAHYEQNSFEEDVNNNNDQQQQLSRHADAPNASSYDFAAFGEG